MQIPPKSLIIGIASTRLTAAERIHLTHPAVGGVILFARNYENPQQLQSLTDEIHTLDETLWVCVDQEGGCVQRFSQGFTQLPAMFDIGLCYDQDPAAGLQLAETTAITLATELKQVGVDLTFAPVLDLYNPDSQVIGSRAFHADPQVVAQLATRFFKTLQAHGLLTVGKHYPGHGSVTLDTHTEQVVDTRDFDTIVAHDLHPFTQTIQQHIDGIMAAHVIYPQVDDQPVGYSKRWLDYLRHEQRFSGLTFSDDLGMQAAMLGEMDLTQRVAKALAAGCDKVLLCNELEQIPGVLNL